MSSFSIGVDLGGTNLRAAAYSPQAGLQNRISIPTRLELGPEQVADDLCALVKKIRNAAGTAEKLSGICVAAPGPLELPSGRFHQPPNLPGWNGFNLREVLEQNFDVPITLENDANAAALAEYYLGAGKDLQPRVLCMFTLGTGVGNGIIYRGRVFNGGHGLAGEGGHITVWPDGAPCGCGNYGCLETYASATGIQKGAAELSASGNAPGIASLFAGKPAVTTSDIYDLAVAGDGDAISLFTRAGQALGIAIAVTINVLDPELIVLAGGMAEAWPLFSPAMFEELARRSYIYQLTKAPSAFESPTIVQKARLGAEAGLLGAALYPFLGEQKSGFTSPVENSNLIFAARTGVC